MWGSSNKLHGNGSSGSKFPGNGFLEKSPGNNFFRSESSGYHPPGKRPPCSKLSCNGFPDKPSGIKSPSQGYSGNGFSGSQPPGKRPPGNENPGSIQDGKREALQLCKGRVGSNEQRGAALKSSNSETGREKPTFIFGGNLSTVPSTSEKWNDGSQVRPALFKEIPDLAKALQTAVKETVSDSRLHTNNNLKIGDEVTRPSSTVTRTGGGQEKEERIKQLEQRVGDLEQQFREEKAANETLLASVERALNGEAVETCSELKLVRLIHCIKAKILRCEQGEKVVSLDLNGNEAPVKVGEANKHYKSGSLNIEMTPRVELGLKSRPAVVSKLHPGFLPRALALGTRNKGQQDDLRNVRHHKLGDPVVRGKLQALGSMEEDKMRVENMVGGKLSSKSAQSLSCHLKSPDGRMLA